MGNLLSFLSPVGGLLQGKKPREAISGSFLGPVAKVSPGFNLLFPQDKNRKRRQSMLRGEFTDEQSPLTARA
jgi:hypothetical protein